jgi:hypothetical protein
MLQTKKCKKSVFCAVFLICFLIGTICGVLLYETVSSAHPEWSRSYFLCIYEADHTFSAGSLYAVLAPMILLWVVSLLSFGDRLANLLVVWRGCCASYLFCFAYTSGVSVLGMIFRELLLLAAFYFIYQTLFTEHDSRLCFMRHATLLVVMIVSALVCNLF